MLNFAYIDLTPGLSNPVNNPTHKVLVAELNKSFVAWKTFHIKYDGYKLVFYLTTQRGTSSTYIKGPARSKIKKYLEYSIFIKDEAVENRDTYIDEAFEGVAMVSEKFNVLKSEIMRVREDCKKILKSGT
jgi:hypothetical protein